MAATISAHNPWIQEQFKVGYVSGWCLLVLRAIMASHLSAGTPKFPQVHSMSVLSYLAFLAGIIFPAGSLYWLHGTIQQFSGKHCFRLSVPSLLALAPWIQSQIKVGLADRNFPNIHVHFLTLPQSKVMPVVAHKRPELKSKVIPVGQNQ